MVANLPMQRPKLATGPRAWARKNLFRTWYDSLLTLIVAALALSALLSFIQWSVTDARWSVVTENVSTLMRGIYPTDALWRVTASVLLVVGLAGVSWGVWGSRFRSIGIALFGFAVLLLVVLSIQRGTAAAGSLSRYLTTQFLPLLDVIRDPLLILIALLTVGALLGRGLARANYVISSRALVILWLVTIPLVLLLVRGLTPNTPVLPLVPTSLWGGLLLTFMMAFVASVFCFPLGILLALGRMSGAHARRGEKGLRGWIRSQGNYPVVKIFCTIYIEFLRGVPLVTVLFTANLLVGFALGSTDIDSVVRAMVALTLFEAAYVAEIVRGGLQAVPPGQAEAARAMGLNPLQATLLITLPQALRVVIPSLVGQFITLFKDTSLVAIVGLLDLIGIAESVRQKAEFSGTQREMYVFVAAIYFVICFSMSVAARQLERSGSGRTTTR